MSRSPAVIKSPQSRRRAKRGRTRPLVLRLARRSVSGLEIDISLHVPITVSGKAIRRYLLKAALFLAGLAAGVGAGPGAISPCQQVPRRVALDSRLLSLAMPA